MNWKPINAAGRHALSYSMGAVTALAALHVISAGDAATISASITKISSGVAEIAAGLAPLIALASAFYASWSATHKSQVAAVATAVAAGQVPKVEVLTKIQDAQVAVTKAQFQAGT